MVKNDRNISKADIVIRELNDSRRRITFAIRSVMSEIDNAKVPKSRQAELDFEKHLLEEAMEILMQERLPTAAESFAERQKERDDKMLAKWEEEERLALERGEDLDGIWGLK